VARLEANVKAEYMNATFLTYRCKKVLKPLPGGVYI
jgi:hypothetical protein